MTRLRFRLRFRLRVLLLAGVLLASLLVGCSGNNDSSQTITVVASPELVDLESMLPELRAATGVTLKLDYQPTLAASQAVAAGRDHHDLAWFASDRWLRLRLKQAGRGASSPPSASTMLSPVVLGVKPAVAAALRRANPAGVSWADIADAAAAGKLSFDMVDPQQSDSGLVALVGVATAAADTGGGALQLSDVRCDRLQGLFSGQKLTASSTAGLAEGYEAAQQNVDGVISYESTILGLNASGKLSTGLDIVYPTDGMAMADYPLILLNPDQADAYSKILAWLRRPAVQKELMTRTLRRPLSADVPRDPRLSTPVGNALRFPDDQAVVDRLLDFYHAGQRPESVIFVVDFSGSMRGRRIAQLRAAFAGLSGADTSRPGEFLRFHQGETIQVIRFGGRVLAEATVTYRTEADLQRLRSLVAVNDFDDRTAIWSALEGAYDRAVQIVAKPDAGPTSIVLMTDGEDNAGITLNAFSGHYRSLPAAARAVPTFAVHYGQAPAAQLAAVTTLTHGKLVDARHSSLLDAFQQTRGCSPTTSQ